MELLKEIWSSNPPAAFAVLCLIGYFWGMAVVFISKPLKNAESFSIKPVDNAGKTEIRVYYGGISFALGAFLIYLAVATGTAYYSLIGGMLTGITCVAVYALSLTIFFISNRNNVYEGPLYRLKTKSSFIVFIVATVLLALTTLLTVLVGSSSLKLNFGEIFEVIRVTLLPALLLSIVGLVIYALDFKAIKDEE